MSGKEKKKRKKASKKKKRKESSSNTGSSSNSSSDDAGDREDYSKILENCGLVPEGLTKKQLKTLDPKMALKLRRAQHSEYKGHRVGVRVSARRDKREPIYYSSGEDDGVSVFHPARFAHPPTHTGI